MARGPAAGSSSRTWHSALRVIGLVLGVTLAQAGVRGLSAQSDGHPNILFISVDDLNDWVGVMGGADQVLLDPTLRQQVTPELDRLASRATTFVNAQTASPACTPSRAALMTGIAPSTSGLWHNRTGTHFRSFASLRWATSLPQHLKTPTPSSELYTIKSSGKMFHTQFKDTRDEVGFPAAFTNWDALPRNAGIPIITIPGGLGFDGWRTDYARWDFDKVTWGREIPTLGGHDVTDPVARRAFADLKFDPMRASWGAREVRNDAPGGAPKFVAVGIFRPHVPWEVPIQFFERFPLGEITVPEPPVADLTDLPRGHLEMGDLGIHPRVLANSTSPGYPGEVDIAWRLAIQAYLASSAYADDAVGKLIREVEIKNTDADPSNDWTVVVWSDHGQHLGEKSRWKKFTLWREAARSLLMFWQPGLTQPGAIIDEPVDFLDIYPTVCELAGVEPPAQLQGRSLVPYLRHPESLTENFAFTTWGRGGHSVRSRRWRYIRYRNGDEELYDRFHDARENFNLLHPSNAERLTEFGLAPEFVQRVRRSHLSELVDWSVRTRNKAMFESPRELSLDATDVLGRRVSDRFDTSGLLSSMGWTPQPAPGATTSTDFSVTGGRVRPALVERALVTRNGLTLSPNENFIAAVDVRLSTSSIGMGLLFGHQDSANFLEFQLINERSPSALAGLDARLVEFSGGIESELLAFHSMRRPEAPEGRPLDFSAGDYRLLASYSASESRLEVMIQNAMGVNLFRATLPEFPIAAGSSFGLTSWSADSTSHWDDFVVLTREPDQLLGPVVEPVSREVSAMERDGALTVELLLTEPRDEPTTVTYTTQDATAWPGRDYVRTTGDVTWPPGDSEPKTVTIELVDDDVVEPSETLHLALSSQDVPLLGANLQLVIEDDDEIPETCLPTANSLCLLDGRFVAQAEWRTTTDAGLCQWQSLTDEAGYCWFFTPNNVEVIIKLLDACSQPSSNFWFFATGLTDVETATIVLDTQSGQRQRYESSGGVGFVPVLDTSAFDSCPP